MMDAFHADFKVFEEGWLQVSDDGLCSYLSKVSKNFKSHF